VLRLAIIMTPLWPSQLGSNSPRTEIIALLDKGGMGEVYRGGRDTKLKREVADPNDYDSGYGTRTRANLAAWSRNIST